MSNALCRCYDNTYNMYKKQQINPQNIDSLTIIDHERGVYIIKW